MRPRPASRSTQKPLFTAAATSARMLRIRQQGTQPELTERSFLRSEGVRYRCNFRNFQAHLTWRINLRTGLYSYTAASGTATLAAPEQPFQNATATSGFKK